MAAGGVPAVPQGRKVGLFGNIATYDGHGAAGVGISRRRVRDAWLSASSQWGGRGGFRYIGHGRPRRGRPVLVSLRRRKHTQERFRPAGSRFGAGGVANAGFAGGFQYGGIGHSGWRDLRVVVGIKSITSLLRRSTTARDRRRDPGSGRHRGHDHVGCAATSAGAGAGADRAGAGTQGRTERVDSEAAASAVAGAQAGADRSQRRVDPGPLDPARPRSG